jgi:beta-glucanase (GH16 family)
MSSLAQTLACLAALQPGAADPAPFPTIPPAPGYTLVFSDEFDGTTLDESKWSHYAAGPRRDAVNVPEAVSLDGQGHLLITTSRGTKPDGTPEYRTGMITTRGHFEAQYGYFECRMQVQRQIGHWSAFWIQTPTMGQPLGDPAAAGVEIDVLEYLRNGDYADKAQHTIHWDAHTDRYQKDHHDTRVPGIGEGFHTYGCEWTPQFLAFFVDGVETWRTSKAVPKRPEFIILSDEVGKWADDIAKATLPDSMIVDYVRVYQKPGAEPVSKPDQPAGGK